MTDDYIDDEKIRMLSERVAQLPREIDPPANAWAGIRATIEQGDRQSARNAGVKFWQKPLFLAAAGLVLVAGTSLATASYFRSRPVAVEAPPIVLASEQSQGPSTLAEFTVLENEYIKSASRLSELLDSDQMQLSEQTKAKLKESLKVIDGAILEARRALAADPANKKLIEMLSTSYNHKIDLLKRTTEMGRS